jgi:hypothetical protein
MTTAAILEQIDTEQAAAFRARHPGIPLVRIGTVWLAHVTAGSGGYTAWDDRLGVVIDSIEAFLRGLRGG